MTSPTGFDHGNVRVMLFADDARLRADFEGFFAQNKFGYAITVASSLARAREFLLAGVFDIIVAENTLFDGTVFDLLPNLEVCGETTRVILIARVEDEAVAARAARAGIADYLVWDDAGSYLRALARGIDFALCRRQTAALSRARDAQLKDVFNGSLDLVQSVTLDGTIRFVNRAWCEALGYTLVEVIGLNIFSVIDPTDRAHCQAVFKRLVEKEAVDLVEVRFRTKGGSVVYLEGRVALREMRGQVTFTVGIFRDVSERARRERVFRSKHERQEFFLGLSKFVLYSCAAEAPFPATFVTASVKAVWGYEVAEFLQPNFWSDHVEPSDLARIFGEIGNLFAFGTHEFTYRFLRADGEWRWVHDALRLVADSETGTQAMLGLMTDVTDRRLAKDALQEKHEQTLRLQAALLHLSEPVGLDLGSFCQLASETAARAINVQAASVWMVSEPGGELLERKGHCKLGTEDALVSPVTFASMPLFWAGLGAAPIITSEDLARDPLAGEIGSKEVLPIGAKAMLAVRLTSGGQIIGALLFFDLESRREWEVAETKFAWSVASRILVAAERQARLVAESAELALRINLEKIVHERTSALSESEERFRQLAENSDGVAYMAATVDARFLYVSPAFSTLFQRSIDALYLDPRLWISAVHPDDRAAFALYQSQRLLEPASLEYRIVDTAGSEKSVYDRSLPIKDSTGVIYRITGLALDITERKRAASYAARRQRMEDLGTLVSGVAHYLNNALTPVRLGLDLLRKRYPLPDKLFESMEVSTLHGSNLIRQLLTFAKGIEGKRVGLASAGIVAELVKLIGATFPKNIILRTHFDEGEHPVVGDATQLYQVLLNLCVNARDAMPAGGRLDIEVGHQKVDATYLATQPDAQLGNYVTWLVRDSGEGISPQNLDHIFDPFFSTKSPEKGLGMGLATVLGLVRSHGGFLRVQSVEGKGSSFWVYLPMANSSVSPPSLQVLDLGENRNEHLAGAGETVLVVDDEPAIVAVMVAVLSDHQFRVITGKDGTDAMIRVAENRGSLCGVITDFNMPDTNGLKLVRTLRHMAPGVPIIVASGFISDGDAKELRDLGVVAILNKPFTEVDLIAAMAVLMGTPRR
ncbi:MAG: hypothetical protein RL077_2481 [Verrucomicrobiota bacterium]